MSPLNAALSLVALVLSLGAPPPRHDGACFVTQDRRALLANEARLAGSIAAGIGRARARLDAPHADAATPAAHIAAAVLGASERAFTRVDRNLSLQARDRHCRTVL
jgi:hypothetical protein